MFLSARNSHGAGGDAAHLDVRVEHPSKDLIFSRIRCRRHQQPGQRVASRAMAHLRRNVLFLSGVMSACLFLSHVFGVATPEWIYSKPEANRASWQEMMDVYDAANIPVGTVDNRTIHREGLYTHTVTLFLCRVEADGSGRLLLQKRSDEKIVFPEKWEYPAKHLQLGESALRAAVRTLLEESRFGARGEAAEGDVVDKFRTEYHLRRVLLHHAVEFDIYVEQKQQHIHDQEFQTTWRIVLTDPQDVARLDKIEEEIGEQRWFALPEIWSLAAKRPLEFAPWLLSDLLLLGKQHFAEICSLELANNFSDAFSQGLDPGH